MFVKAFRSIDDALRNDAGCSTELDYIEQTSWILFLKYLEDYENEKEGLALMSGEDYRRIIKDEYRWSQWAMPKLPDGKLDKNKALTGADLLKFVNDKLFPYLANFKHSADSPDTIHYKIGEIFSEVRNKLHEGYSLREVINKVDELSFLSDENKHELSSLYEEKIKKMGNAGRNGGEYYTPRPLIKAIVQIITPKIGETVYDGAVGSAGFLCEAYAHMKGDKDLSVKNYKQLQTKTFYGKEKKSLAYVIGIMNMILHGIKAPNIIHTNTLAENISDIQDKDRVDIVLANPPFGSNEHDEIQQNFLTKTSETAYFFLQHFIKKLKAGGRCGMVIKNTFLSNTDRASVELRKQLLKKCNLFAVLAVPDGAFIVTDIKTVVLFFKKGEPTKKIWYYEINLDRNLGKTNPLNGNDMADFVELAKTKAESDNSWFVDAEDINKETWELTVKNPNTIDETDPRTPLEIMSEIENLQAQSAEALQAIKELL